MRAWRSVSMATRLPAAFATRSPTMPSEPLDPLEIALAVARALAKLGIPYFLGGSLASSLQGEPRATNDIDFVVDLTEAVGTRLCRRARARLRRRCRGADRRSAPTGFMEHLLPEGLRTALKGGGETRGLASETELRVGHPRLDEQASPSRLRRRSGDGGQPSLLQRGNASGFPKRRCREPLCGVIVANRSVPPALHFPRALVGAAVLLSEGVSNCVSPTGVGGQVWPEGLRTALKGGGETRVWLAKPS